MNFDIGRIYLTVTLVAYTLNTRKDKIVEIAELYGILPTSFCHFTKVFKGPKIKLT